MSSQFEKAENGEIAQVNALPPRQALGSSNARFRKFGNPGPLGLFAFASTTLMLSLFNATARGIHVPNAVVGMALFVGGLAQLLAGMWEFAGGNTFSATAFTMFGGFWMSYATVFIPGSGIQAAYNGNTEEFNSAIGIYLMMWFIITFLLFIGSLRRNIGLVALFFFLTLTFLLLGIGSLISHTAAACTKAGGALGIVTAFIAFYVGTAQLLAREESWFTLPLGELPQRLN
ncbi:hypothetical protein AcW1_000012 [Taiwanofungus camphoratus]|nr:hypothetical protein AcV7_007066 [Antrodia cinnamomea]KAI0933054.1 hypothetical protein AcW2_001494 [Antrodia cinnamomea]KAI0935487.1 hypothetical protein AcV5_003902 [Antrodia cinnamomea]KAI0962717.1 hypothetical protein AcW1_000012 [Antrodia cinnamomea]